MFSSNQQLVHLSLSLREELLHSLYTPQAPLLLCHASRSIFSQFSERQTGTYHPIHEAEREGHGVVLGGKVGEGLPVWWTSQLFG